MKKTFCFILSIIIVINFSAVTVFAVDLDEQDTLFKDWEIVEDDESDLDIIKKNIPAYIQFLLAQTGVTFCDHDFSRVWDDTEKWFDENRTKMVVVKNKKTGEKGIRVKKSVTDELLNNLKESNKQPENGGYELVKTVPLSQISTMYFDSVAEYKTLLNLLNDNDGYVGFYRYGGYKSSYFKVNMNEFWIKLNTNEFYNGDSRKEFSFYRSVKNANSGSTPYSFYALRHTDTPIKNWNDSDNIWCFRNDYVYSFYGMDLFDFYRNSSQEAYYNNPFNRGQAFIISTSGASIPVFNTLNDAIRYMVDHNLYYTGSNYTGEGKEIVIPFDEIDKILNGYYDDMYDMLQRLIEQSGSNALTPEQLQKLVDEVQTTFGMLKQTINEGFEQQDILIQKNSQILQNTADALNAFFSQTKEFRSTFLKSFNDYTKGEKERDEMLYNLLSDYIESQKNGTDDGDSPGDGENPDDGETKENFLKKIYGMVKDGFDDVVKELKKIKHWTAVDTLLDGADAVGEWVSFLTDLLDPEKALDAVTDFVSTGADALSGVKELIDDKFPFCIPVDILVLMQTLSAEPEAPKFEIPFVLERYGIDEKVVIDLKDFGIVSDICRTFLTVLWCCSLMNFTTKITDMKGI